jgi:hypothetical protein
LQHPARRSSDRTIGELTSKNPGRKVKLWIWLCIEAVLQV